MRMTFVKIHVKCSKEFLTHRKQYVLLFLRPTFKSPLFSLCTTSSDFSLSLYLLFQLIYLKNHIYPIASIICWFPSTFPATDLRFLMMQLLLSLLSPWVSCVGCHHCPWLPLASDLCLSPGFHLSLWLPLLSLLQGPHFLLHLLFNITTDTAFLIAFSLGDSACKHGFSSHIDTPYVPVLLTASQRCHVLSPIHDSELSFLLLVSSYFQLRRGSWLTSAGSPSFNSTTTFSLIPKPKWGFLFSIPLVPYGHLYHSITQVILIASLFISPLDMNHLYVSTSSK